MHVKNELIIDVKGLNPYEKTDLKTIALALVATFKNFPKIKIISKLSVPLLNLVKSLTSKGFLVSLEITGEEFVDH